MGEKPQEPKTWQDQDKDVEQALEEMHRGIQRVREQVRTYREVLQPELHEEP